MKNKKLIMPTMLSVATVLISACGGSSGSNEPAQGAAVAQTESAAGTPYVGITDEELGWRAEVPETQTAALLVNDDFNFETARQTRVEFNLPEASGENAEATFCTEYTSTADGYEVDYGSCVLNAPLIGGQLSEELNLVNQYDRVLGIVWFEDASKAPVYQEFVFN